MKKFLGIVLFISLFFVPQNCYGVGAAVSEDNMLSQTAELVNLDEVENFLNYLDEDMSNRLGDFTFYGLWQQFKNGDLHFNLAGFLQVLVTLIFREIAANAGMMGQLIVLAVLCVMITNLQDAFESQNVSVLCRSVIYLVLISIAITSFSAALTYAKSSIENMSDFLLALLPVMMSLLASMGGMTAVALVHPSILLVVSVFSNLIKNFIFPLIYFSVILKLVSYISPKFNLEKMAALLKDVAMGVMTLTTTLFIGFLSISGLCGASIDGLAVKAAKSATGIFIPVVGRSLADCFDTVMGVSLLLKNGLGLLGVIVIIVICVLPAIRILGLVFVYRLSAAIIQPLGDNLLANALSGLANSLTLIFAVLAIMGVVFFFIIGLTVGMSNITMFMR